MNKPATPSPRLTIVLPLKGRERFTLRFLWHANRARLPYRFLIADGQVHPALAGMLENSAEHFPNLDIDYVRYPDDSDFARFFAKMADAFGRVTTPYAMIADNDDFLVGSGLERSLDFLEAHADYMCCGGGVGGFSVYSRTRDLVRGSLNKLAFRYMPYDRSTHLGSPQMLARLLPGLRNSWSFYAVFRAPAAATIWRELAEMNLSDLQLQEKYFTMRTLTLGKAFSDAASFGYMRQYWTSSGSAFKKDWVHHLLRSRFSTDFDTIIGRISKLAADADGVDQIVVAEDLREKIEPWLRDFIRRNYGMSAMVRKYIRDRVPSLLMWLKMRRRFSLPFERRSILATLRKSGASDAYVERFSAELAQIEDAIAGPAFRDFLALHEAKFTTEPATAPSVGVAAPLTSPVQSQNG